MKGSLRGDFSRFLFDPRKHYSGVLQQQGRVQLDADWNAQAEILAHRLRTEARDTIGPSGGPAGSAGFEVLPYYGLHFDGERCFATVGGSGVPLFAAAGGLTLEVWLQAHRGGTLLSRACRGENERAFREDLSLEILADGRLRWHRAAATAADLETEVTIPFDHPCQIAVTATPSESRLYVNGRLAAADVHGSPARGGAETTLLLGASLVDGSLAGLFEGFLYELRFWGVARGEEEIGATLRRSPPRPDPALLLGWWRFDQGRGGTVADRSAHGNPCLLGGGRHEHRPRWTLRTLLVGAGRYYVEGILCANEARVPFTQQEDFPGAALPPLEDGASYLFYLDVWERSVTAREDPALREVALGGADTTVFNRVLAQVKWLPVASDGDAAGPGGLAEWRELLAGERERGRLRARRDAQDQEILGNLLYRVEIHHGGAPYGWPRSAAATAAAVPVAQVVAKTRQVRLADAGAWEVGEWVELFSAATDVSGQPGPLARIVALDPASGSLTFDVDLAALEADAGLLLRRVASFKWSRQNAALAWSVDRVQGGSRLVSLAATGQDDLELAAGDWIEIVDDELVLQNRVENLHQIESVDFGLGQVTLSEPLPGRRAETAKLHPLLRRWDGHQGIAPARQGWSALEAGLEVAFAPSATYRTADYWLIPARTATQSIDWPAEGADEGRPPDGVDHYYAPLAFLGCDAEGLTSRDCRSTFQPLTTGAVSKAGDTVDGSLEVRGNVTVLQEIRAEALHGTVATVGGVGSEAIADGAVLASKLAPGIGTVPAGAAILVPHRDALPGYAPTGFALTLFQPEPRWIVRREIPRASGGTLASVAARGRIYTLTEEGELWEYDPASNGWQARRPLPSSRHGFAFAAVGYRLLAVGGVDVQGVRDGATLEYDPAADMWRERRPMPTPRSALAAAAYQGTLFALGGLAGASPRGKVSDRNEAYDADSDAWTRRRRLPSRRFHLGAAALAERIHVLGGAGRPLFGLAGRTMSVAHSLYDPAADRWESELTPLPRPRAGFGVAVTAGRLYVVGGRGPLGETADVEEYDPATGSWQPRPPLPAPLAAAGVAASDGTLYVTGGQRTVLVQECALAAMFWVQRKKGE